MGKINVEGLGVVEIAGDEPTAAEALDIKNRSEEILAENLSEAYGNKQGEEYAEGVNFKRVLLEVGLSIGGALATGGAALPVIAARASMLSRPFFSQLAKSSFGSAVGGGVGGGLAQTFDPKDDIVREIARAATEGALGEFIGAPIAIKGATYMKKALGNWSERVGALEFADEAERNLITKAQDIQLEQAVITGDKKLFQQLVAKFGPQVDKSGNVVSKGRTDIPSFESIKNNKNLSKDPYKKADIKFAQEVEGGLTPGIKTSSRTLEIFENIAQKSLIGGGAITARYEALQEVGNKLAMDYVNDLKRLGGEGTVNEAFFKSLSGAKDMWSSSVSGAFKGVDKELIQSNMFDTGFIPIREILKGARRGQKFNYDGALAKGLDEDLLSMDSFLARFGGLDNTRGVTNFIKGDLTNYIQRASLQGGRLTLTDADDLRKIIGKKLADAKKTGDSIATNFYTGLYKNLNEQYDILANSATKAADAKPIINGVQLPVRAAVKLKEAIKMYREGADVFNTKQIDTILKSGSDKTASTTDNIFKTIIQSNGTKTAERVYRRIDELTKIKGEGGKPILAKADADVLKNKMKGTFVWEKIYAPSLKSGERQYGGEFIDADLFKNNLKKWKDYSDFILDPKEVKALEDVGRDLAFAQGKLSRLSNPPGGVFIQLKQAGEATKLLQFGAAGYSGLQDGSIINPTSATIMLGPWGVAKALLNPKINKLLFKGMGDATATDTPQKAAMLFRRIVAQMTAGGIYEPEQKAILDQYSREFERGNTILQPAQPLTAESVENLPDLPLENLGDLPNVNVTGGPETRSALATGNLDAAIAARGMFEGGIVNAKKINK